MESMVKILIVDDEPVYCRNLSILLEKRGYQVQIASDGPAALKLIETFQPELLIVDWMLRSEMNGQQLAARLHECLPRLRSILITGFPAEEIEAQIDASPIAALLRKPFSMDELIAQVEAILGPESC